MNVFVFDTPEALAETGATLWAKKIWDNTELRVCLTDGKTPELLYRKMVDFYHEGQVCLRDIEAFLLDEFGGLEAHNPGRAQQVIRDMLLNWVDFPAGHFQCMEPNATDLNAEIARYDALFEENPLDLTIISLGRNGHLGMNEPGSFENSPTRKIALSQTSITATTYYMKCEKFPTWGVTLGMNRIMQSKEVWLLATGTYKAEILAKALTLPPTPDVPATYLQHHPNCTVFTDKAAYKLLGK